MPTTRDCLQNIIDLLEPPGAWCANALACDIEGNPCAPGSSSMISQSLHCALLMSAASPRHSHAVRMALTTKVRALGSADIEIWCNAPGRTQAEVIAMLQTVLPELPGS